MSPSTKRILQWERTKRLLSQLQKEGLQNEAWRIAAKLYHVPREVALRQQSGRPWPPY
jgi:hypothetical protein